MTSSSPTDPTIALATEPLKASVIHGYGFNLMYAQRLVADVPDERMVELPHPGMNHPAWVLTHLVVTCDYVGSLLDVTPVCPSEWRERLKSDGPLPDPSRYPAKASLLQQLADAHERVAAAFGRATPEQLGAETPSAPRRRRFPTIGMQLIYGMGPHEALHLGQVSAWRRVLGFPSVSLVP